MSIRTILGLLLALAVLGASQLDPSGSAPATVSAAPAIDPAARAAGASEDWWQAAGTDIARAEYHASLSTGGLQAPNRAHGFRTYFERDGIVIMPRAAADAESTWRWRFAARRFGRAGALVDLGAAEPEVNGCRVSYSRSGLVEWYENSERGLEQGFSVRERPGGTGPLCIRGVWEADLRAEYRGEEGAVDFLDGDGTTVLRYGGLVVRDATGEEVESRLVLAGTELAMEIEDHGATYPLTVDPLMTSPAWTAEGNQESAYFGYSVGTAGDVNGDGYSDVIVGTYLYDNGQTNEGRAFVYHGSATGLSATAAWTDEPDQAEAYFGVSVATAGDVNGDGYSDVIVGAEMYDNGEANEGIAVVYHGSATGLGSDPAWGGQGNQASANFGHAVATAGDVNGDGYADVMVSAYGYDNGEADEGRAFVYHGSASGLGSVAAWTAEGNQAGALFGASVSTAGDVNGDAYSDVVVGAFNYDNGQADEGRALVYHGSSGGLSPTAAWTRESDQAGAWYGYSVGTVGDVNGDGFSDVMVGASYYDNGENDEGRAFLYHGSAAGLTAAPVWTAEGNQAGAQFGKSVATAGDVNGDGFADVVIRASDYDNGETDEGRAYVYQGSAAGLATTPVWTAEGNQVGAYYGHSVGTAGDVNGDGYSDLIVSAVFYDNGQTDEGRAFVYHGAGDNSGANPQFTLPLHAKSSPFEPCTPYPPVDCEGQRPVTQVSAGPVAAYLMVYNHNNITEVQTAFQPDPSWTYAYGLWDCPPGANASLQPAPPFGPTAGTLKMTFDCITNPSLLVVGRIFFANALSGCLEQVQSSYPLGTHVVDCSGRYNQIRSEPQRLGKICVGPGGWDACDRVECAVSPTYIDFGDVLAGESRVRSFTMRNLQISSLSGSVVESCDGYSLLAGGGPYTLAPGESRTVTVEFRPEATGTYPCTIETGTEICTDVTVTGSSCGSNPLFTLPLHASASDPECEPSQGGLPVDCDGVRPTVQVGAGPHRIFLLVNNHGCLAGVQTAINWEGWTFVSGDWDCLPSQINVVTPHDPGGPTAGTITTAFNTISSPSLIVVGSMVFNSPGWGCVSAVESSYPYGTHVIGSRGEVNGINFSLPNQELRLGRICSGSFPGWDACDPIDVCAVSPTSLNFGHVPLGGAAQRSFTFRNLQGNNLSGSVVESCAGYSLVAGGGPYTLASGESRTVTVEFRPEVVGIYPCTIETGANVCSDVTATGMSCVVPTPLPACRALGSGLLFGERHSADATSIPIPPNNPFYFDSTEVTITRQPGYRYFIAGRSDTLGSWINIGGRLYINGGNVALGTAGWIGGREFCRPPAEVYSSIPAREVTNYIPVGTSCVDFKLAEMTRDAYGNSEIYLLAIPPDPGGCVVRGWVDTPGLAKQVVVSGSHAFVADWGSGLQVIDVSSPTAPVVVGSADTPGTAKAVDISGDYAYVADGNSGLQVIRVSDPGSPAIVGSVSGVAERVAIDGTHAYVTSGSAGFRVIDVSNPLSPVVVGSLSIPLSSNGDVALAGSFAYVTTADMAENPDFLVIDVSDPTSPTMVGSLNVLGVLSGVAVVGDYAYVTAAGRGLHVVDVAIPGAPEWVSSVSTFGDIRAVDVAMAGGYALVADFSAGLTIVDVTTPDLPSIVRTVDTPGATCGAFGLGGYAYVADNQNGLVIISLDCIQTSVPETPTPAAVPAALSLDALPNPASAGVTLRYALPATATTRLVIYNASGRLVRTLYDGTETPGLHERQWDGRDSQGRRMGAAVYFARLESGAETRTSRLVLIP